MYTAEVAWMLVNTNSPEIVAYEKALCEEGLKKAMVNHECSFTLDFKVSVETAEWLTDMHYVVRRSEGKTWISFQRI